MDSVTIHQPSFLPWEGFFAKMQRADLMVLLDHVQFSKNNYTNRVKIRTKQGWKWLTVPVPKGSNHKAISEIRLNLDTKWKEKHKKTLCFQYAKAPYFDESIINTIYNHPIETLVDLNILGIEKIKELANIGTSLIRSSELDVSNLSKTELLLEVIKKVGGTRYISGPDGRNYIDVELFINNGVEIEFFDFTQTKYRQTFPGFEPGLTALDRFFNTGVITK